MPWDQPRKANLSPTLGIHLPPSRKPSSLASLSSSPQTLDLEKQGGAEFDRVISGLLVGLHSIREWSSSTKQPGPQYPRED
ncbi:MAG: hypothetical protein ACK53Y_09720, partial [bacterium]